MDMLTNQRPSGYEGEVLTTVFNNVNLLNLAAYVHNNILGHVFLYSLVEITLKATFRTVTTDCRTIQLFRNKTENHYPSISL